MTKQKKEKRGRPKTAIDLPKNWQEHIINLYKDGASDVEIRAWIYEQRGSFSLDLWERWIDEEQNFSETIKNGRLLSQAWWEKKGRTELENQKFNHGLWYMNMKNRFGWKDRQEIEATNEVKAEVIIK